MRRNRLFPIVAALTIGPIVAFVTIGNGQFSFYGVLLVVSLGVAWALSRRGRRGGADVGWAPPPAIDPALLRPVAEPARGSVALALGRVEAGLLATNAWFVVGLGFCLVIVSMFGIAFSDELDPSWWGVLILVPLLVHPITGGTIVATHRGVTRSRRDGTEELFLSCPAGWDARARGHLLTAWVAAVAAALFLLTFAVAASITNPNIAGPFGGRGLIDLAVALGLPVGGVALGVAVGRWAPWSVAPIAAVVLVGIASGRILDIGGNGSWVTDHWLSTFVPDTDADSLFFAPPGWERVAWFAALTVAVAALALLKGPHSRRVPLVLAGALVVAVVAAAAVASPVPTAEAAERASLISDFEAHQTCEEVGTTVSVCVYHDYAYQAEGIREHLAPVAAALPTGVPAEPAVFRQFVDSGPEGLQPEVAALLEPEDFERPGLRLHFSTHPDTYVAARLRLATYAAGLPTEAVSPDVPTVVAGEARGAVVLWLATRGLGAGAVDDLLAPTLEGPGPFTANDRGDAWPARCSGEDAVLIWAQQDLQAAQELVAAPDDRVHDAIAADWDRWMDPGTSTDELLVALDLEPVGRPDAIEPRADPC